MKNVFGYKFIEEFELKREERKLFLELIELKKRLKN